MAPPQPARHARISRRATASSAVPEAPSVQCASSWRKAETERRREGVTRSDGGLRWGGDGAAKGPVCESGMERVDGAHPFLNQEYTRTILASMFNMVELVV